jgi:hypothetical protein
MTKTNRNSIDLDRYDAEEQKSDRGFFVGLTANEKREAKRRLDCGSGGHTALASAWRQLVPAEDGRLHATCPVCAANVSRSAFVN